MKHCTEVTYVRSTQGNGKNDQVCNKTEIGHFKFTNPAPTDMEVKEDRLVIDLVFYGKSAVRIVRPTLVHLDQAVDDVILRFASFFK